MTQPPPDREAEVLAALDFPTPCSHPECAESAAVQGFYTACGASMTQPACITHLVHLVASLTYRNIAHGAVVQCVGCHQISIVIHMTWRPL